MRILSLLTFFTLLISCHSGVEYSQYVSLPNGWEQHKPMFFELEEKRHSSKEEPFYNAPK